MLLRNAPSLLAFVVDSRGQERFDLWSSTSSGYSCRTCAGTQHALEDVPLNRVRKNATDLRDRLSRTYGASDVLAHLLLSVIADGPCRRSASYSMTVARNEAYR
jgi:hypothetical protein